MKEILSVRGLSKRYEHFALKEVSFALQPGTITGFIGRNGAGKTTTLKSLLHFVHPDAGEIRFFGEDFTTAEQKIKEQIGFVSGGVDYYPAQKLATIAKVTRRFYPAWDEDAYQGYLHQFGLEEGKRVKELSAGMKVKFALALALSHRARLLLLDEPTSGLDPVSRDELLDIFLTLAQTERVTILFSTHITSDLEKCADHLIYIRRGEIIGDDDMDAFLDRYRLVQLSKEELSDSLQHTLIGCTRQREGYTALVKKDQLPDCAVRIGPATLADIMVHLEKEGS